MEIQKSKIEIADNGKSFVGLSYDSKNNQLLFTFPMGYGVLETDNPSYSDENIQTLIRLIYESKKKGYLPVEDSENNDFPIYEYLYVLNYFIGHDFKYYRETESVYDTGSNGRISWSRTIKNTKPTLINNQPFYLETVKRHFSPKDNDLITLINKYCVSKAVELFSSIYGNIQVEKCPEIEQYDLDYLLSFLYQKINSTNNDENKTLFNAMISILNVEKGSNHDSDEKKQKMSFGTESFASIWEEIVDDIFGTESDQSKRKYNPYAQWSFIDESRKHLKKENTSRLEVDTINITGNKVYIIDAKNYPFGKNIYNPSSSDLPKANALFKQFYYMEYAQKDNDNLAQYTINKMSPFIIPFDHKDNSSMLQLRGAVKQGEYYVLAVLLDTKYAIDLYLNGLSNDKKNLRFDLIKMIDDENDASYNSLFIFDKYPY